jgi:hypothetical protein
MARKKMNRPYSVSMDGMDCCYDGKCPECKDKALAGTVGVESGLNSRESMGRADVGTVKSFELVEGQEDRPDVTNNPSGRVF